ncbi:granzyme A-like [Equus przewalskii]|uniref:Peptidase S1 domain-containing protein n=2 Tax=Equus TaxID=9789 RepID=A0A3Q2I8D2_HORSE
MTKYLPLKRRFPIHATTHSHLKGLFNSSQAWLTQDIRLEGKATITKATKTGDVKPHTKFHVAGRGSTKRDSCKISNTLREVNVTVIDQKLCNDVEHYNFTPVIDNSMIRAGPRKGEDDS